MFNYESSMNNDWTDNCPLINEEIKKLAKESITNPDKIWLYMFMSIFLSEIQKEKGLEGLRELEKQYKEKLAKSET